MKRVFLDTNILVDYALGREHGPDAMQLLQRGKDGVIDLFASYLTFANMAYILKNKVDVYGLLSHLCRFITVLPTDGGAIAGCAGTESEGLRGYAAVPMC